MLRQSLLIEQLATTIITLFLPPEFSRVLAYKTRQPRLKPVQPKRGPIALKNPQDMTGSAFFKVWGGLTKFDKNRPGLTKFDRSLTKALSGSKARFD